LNARSDIWRLAEHFALRIDHDGPHVEADAGGKLRRVLASVAGVDLGEGALDGERGANGPFGVVLLRLRITKQGHQPVAEPLQHMPAEGRDGRLRRIEIGVDQVTPVLRVEPRGEARRADEIAEHHRDRAALGRSRVRGCRARRMSSGGFGSCRGRRYPREARDRLQQSFAVAERQSEFLKLAVVRSASTSAPIALSRKAASY
jgi:hypothetical protein